MTSFEAKERLMNYTSSFSSPYMGGVWEAKTLGAPTS
jgi:hypothetical protein